MTTNNAPTSGTYRIVATIVDVHQVTFYKEDGTKIVIPQGDIRLKTLVDTAIPQINEKGYADLNFGYEGTGTDNAYGNFEKKSGGVIKFFRIAKEKVNSWFGAKDEKPTEPVPVQAVGVIPGTKEQPSKLASTQIQDGSITTAKPMDKAIQDIMAHAVPVSDPRFHEHGLDRQGAITEMDGKTPNHAPPRTSTDTIVAVVETKNGPSVVPGVERVRNQISRAERLGTPEGVANFMSRLGNVIQERRHSVDDLLKFLERGDLPIATDGSILIYKVLRRKDKEYVDCHTGKVRQWVGARVCMDPSLVDHNWNNECSNGLHVARRGYIGGFSGDVCVLAKLYPEYVIAVPAYDANKMRVCAYEIIVELPEEHYQLLRRNQPITNTESGKRLLAEALTKSYPVTHEVRITEQKGGGLVITDLRKNQPKPEGTKEEKPPVAVVTEPVPVPEEEPAPAPTLPKKVETLDTEKAEAFDTVLDPKEVINQVLKAEMSRKEQINALLKVIQENSSKKDRHAALDKLLEIKKASKRSWDQLGVTPDITKLYESGQPAPTTKPTKGDTLGKTKVEKQGENKNKSNPKGVSTDGGAATPSMGEKPRDKIAILMGKLLQAKNGSEEAKRLAGEINLIKRSSKKGWGALGVTPEQATRISRNLE